MEACSVCVVHYRNIAFTSADRADRKRIQAGSILAWTTALWKNKTTAWTVTGIEIRVK